mmetsp:Transcript_136205/g.379708  ORF Transcript_136205/g.379708 Transcript_136205/m.379708 type:complete len:246 (-) Transcript_136205:520-1257(-)
MRLLKLGGHAESCGGICKAGIGVVEEDASVGEHRSALRHLWQQCGSAVFLGGLAACCRHHRLQRCRLLGAAIRILRAALLLSGAALGDLVALVRPRHWRRQLLLVGGGSGRPRGGAGGYAGASRNGGLRVGQPRPREAPRPCLPGAWAPPAAGQRHNARSLLIAARGGSRQGRRGLAQGALGLLARALSVARRQTCQQVCPRGQHLRLLPLFRRGLNRLRGTEEVGQSRRHRGHLPLLCSTACGT